MAQPSVRELVPVRRQVGRNGFWIIQLPIRY